MLNKVHELSNYGSPSGLKISHLSPSKAPTNEKIVYRVDYATMDFKQHLIINTDHGVL